MNSVVQGGSGVSMDTVLALMDYFERKGWSSEYAFKLLVAQSAKVSAAPPCLPSNPGMENRALAMGLANYIKLVDNICASLGPFMAPGEAERMRRELLAIGKNH